MKKILAGRGAVDFEDAARHTTHHWLAAKLDACGLGHANRDAEWGSLLDRTRQAALQGHDPDQLLDRAIDMRPIDDAHSTAGILHWRLGHLAGNTEPARRPGPLRSLPPAGTDDPHDQLARAAGDLIRQRWHQIRTDLAGHDGLLHYARNFGPRPDDAAEARSWITAATAITAYRERYDLPHHLQLLGERPGPLRPDAQAAYDHALHQHDHHLARQHRRLDHDALQALRDAVATASRRTAQLDPDELQQASAQADQTRRHWRTTSVQPDRRAARDQHQHAHAHLDSLEHLAAAHGRARHAAHRARDHARQLDLLPRQTDSPTRR